MLLAPIYNYIKLVAFSLSLISFVAGILIYIRLNIKQAEYEVKGIGSYKEKESKGFDITQCDFEVHTKESIWKK
ncbi:MAG: hypothetical protein IKR70_03125 [Lachnospiraceae bacterium]|nr:hypothetical protein [Lachnospiraceae bacterium]